MSYITIISRLSFQNPFIDLVNRKVKVDKVTKYKEERGWEWGRVNKGIIKNQRMYFRKIISKIVYQEEVT